MKKFLTYQAVSLMLILAAIWVTPVQAFSPVADWLRNEPLAIAADNSLPPGELWRRTELYFGSEKPDGSVVTEREFQQFVDAQVTPHFPDGLTLLAGYGQFRNAAGQIVKERSHVLILLYPMQTGDANMAVEAIRTAYKDAFQQESVLRIDSLSLVSF